MNPEFRRNLWLELSPRRMAVMAGVLGLIFFMAAMTPGPWNGPGGLARFCYYLIAVVWGSRNAAQGVIGEIRMRTWDGQRLSALGAGSMMWGKLFGATAYNWFGGIICLAVILGDGIGHRGLGDALVALVYFLVIAVIAQSAALLASLIAVCRNKAYSRFDVFLYQAIGLVAAVLVYLAWSAGDPSAALLLHQPATAFIGWWGQAFDARSFTLVSLAVFAVWLFVGCYRQMRIELQMRNGPLVWLGFLAFSGIYAAGFDGLTLFGLRSHLDAPMLRLAQALAVFGFFAYAMVILEPKDRVRYRWMAAAAGQLHFGRALYALQGWMMSWLAVFACGIVLIVWLGESGDVADQATAMAWLGFFTRDMALIALIGILSRRMSDLACLALLFVLYALLPSILSGLNCANCLVLFSPHGVGPLWLAPAIAWSEAVLAAVLAILSIALPDKKTIAE
jgi:hypothetical protein